MICPLIYNIGSEENTSKSDLRGFEWFIKLFTEVGDTVLDPFMGSGATNIVANGMRRNSIGIEIIPKYYKMVKSQISHVELYLFESQAKHGTD